MNKIPYYFLLLILLSNLSLVAQNNTNIFDIARKGTVNETKTLLKKNKDILNTVDESGYSPLILACYRGNNEVAQFMIEQGANINYMSGLGTPLMASTVKGNSQMVKILIEKGADVNAKDANGMTALLYAAMFKNHEIASQLVQNKAARSVKDNRGNTPLDYAILADDDKMVEILKSNK